MGGKLLLFGMEASFSRPVMSPAHFPKVKGVSLYFLGFKLCKMIDHSGGSEGLQLMLGNLTNCEQITNCILVAYFFFFFF